MFNYQRLPWDEHPPDAKWASSQLLKTSIFACRHKWRQCFPIDFLSNHQQPKKRGVENPEWDISICAIVGLPLKKISFCHSLPFQMRILIILGYTVHYYTHGIPHFRTNLFAKLLHN